MNKVELWFLRRLLKREFKQGSKPAGNVITFYCLINAAYREEFSEDSGDAMDHLLTTLHRNSLEINTVYFRRSQCVGGGR